jgi:hypothetical protein
MRTQSMKSLTATLSLVALLAITTPVQARPAQPRFGESFVKTIRVFINRVLGGFTSNGLPTTPIPAEGSAPAPAGLPTTPIPLAPEVDEP